MEPLLVVLRADARCMRLALQALHFVFCAPRFASCASRICAALGITS